MKSIYFENFALQCSSTNIIFPVWFHLSDYAVYIFKMPSKASFRVQGFLTFLTNMFFPFMVSFNMFPEAFR